MKKWLIIILSGIVFAGSSVAQSEFSRISYQEKLLDCSSNQELESWSQVEISSKGITILSGNLPARISTKEIPVPLQTIDPFLAAGIVLSIDEYQDADIHVVLRYSSTGKQWIATEIEGREDDGDKNQIAFPLQMLPRDTRFIQVLFDIKATNNNHPTVLQYIKIAFINPGASPNRTLRQERVRTKISLSKPVPTFVSRTDWGCPEGQSSPRWTPLKTMINHFIIHHTATSNSSSDWPAVVRSIWVYHANTLGWGDIGYNWLIDPTGVLYQGRAWLNDSIADIRAGHFCGVSPDPNGINNNEQTMGVSMIGTYMTVAPPVSALATLEHLLAWKAMALDIDPEGSSYHAPTDLMLHNIAGHRDGCSTDCPGDSLYSILPQIRDAVDTIFNHGRMTLQALMKKGWNLFSSPLDLLDPEQHVLPSGSSSLFRYDPQKGYSEQSIPQTGTGYWVKLPSNAPITIIGYIKMQDTIAVDSTWNIIGALAQPVPVSSITTEPDAITASGYFGYEQGKGYFLVDTLKPFQGYWIKSRSTGKMVISIQPVPVR